LSQYRRACGDIKASSTGDGTFGVSSSMLLASEKTKYMSL
jgi:hypothetical protein